MDKKLSDDAIDEVLDQYSNGIPMKEIARKYHISVGAIYYHTKKANLPRRSIGNTIKGPLCTCLKCNNKFIPYKYDYSIYKHICPSCRALLEEVDITMECPIGRMI